MYYCLIGGLLYRIDVPRDLLVSDWAVDEPVILPVVDDYYRLHWVFVQCITYLCPTGPAHILYDTIRYIYVRSKADAMASLI